MSEEERIPLENQDRYGLFRGLWKTWAQACTSPHTLFSKLHYNDEVGLAIFFMFLYAGVTTGIYFLWMVLLSLGQGAMAPLPELANSQEWAAIARQNAFVWGVIALLAPMFVVTLFFLRVLVSHLLLLLFGGGERGMIMTLRAMAYAQAPGLFAVAPCCGLPIRWVWSLVLEILGLAEIHKTDTWRTALAILLPVSFGVLAAMALLAFIWSPLMQEVQQMGFPPVGGR